TTCQPWLQATHHPNPTEQRGGFTQLVPASQRRQPQEGFDAEDGRERLAGGGEAVTVQLDSDACVHDLHIAFANGRRALYPAFDLCRQRGLPVMPLPARSREERLASGGARVKGETAGSH
ncbi:MAG: hypothetical protein MK141_16145, partial [Pseudoxanthomonas sp.]|uniref:hypothetical protein n=2 Tax=Pseudoxanthomonas TaxID=83618 RepID=UPI002586B8AE